MFVNYSVSFISSFRPSTYSKPSINKLVFGSNITNETFGEADDEYFLTDSKYYVSIQFNYESLENLLENSATIIDDNVFIHPWKDQIEKERDYYYPKNIFLLNELGFIDFNCSIYASYYSPFVTLFYDTYDNYIKDMGLILKLNESEFIFKSYTGEYKISSIFSPFNFGESTNYPFSQALVDSGITNSLYTGNNVRVGIMDAYLPDSLTNFIPGKYNLLISAGTTNPSYHPHPSMVGSVLGGIYGVAPNANLFFASNADNSVEEIVDYFYSNNVSVVNMSMGNSTGVYDYYSAIFDYYTTEKKITFVASAGNILRDIKTIYYAEPTTGVPKSRLNNFSVGDNVISVGASSFNKKVSWKSSWEKATSGNTNFEKPNIVAPGEKLIGVGNYSSLDGTSFSSPIVAGIIARLMEENVILKIHPEIFMAILINSASPIDNQIGYNQRSGYGIVNYNEARKLLYNYSSSIVSGNVNIGTSVITKSFYASGNTRIKLTASLFSHVDINLGSAITQKNLYNVVIKNSNGTILQSKDNSSYSPIIFLDFSFYASVPSTYTISILQNNSINVPFNYIVGMVFDVSSEHLHIYNDHYTPNGSKHKAYCVCGDFISNLHVINSNETSNHYANCVLCNASIDLYTTTVLVV
ncbi:MAG: S8/S53 family peptidase [Acholeplasmatales bacterium]|nr:S8/S53 family peptidase [Acholeplasmatales bacterium]